MSRTFIAAGIAVAVAVAAGCPASPPAPIAARHRAPPWTLTASDGSGLLLTRIDARAVVEGPLAFTELHLYFYNPEDRVREGTFAISLPADAAVSRFAMEIGGRMQEAEVVDKSRARRVYEDFLHRKQDPALLERGAGNQFSARVFPIPARGEKHLVLSYSQELRGEPYTLLLRGLPKVAQVDVSLHAMSGSADHALHERDWRPDRDFVAPVSSALIGVAVGTLVVVPVAVDASTPRGSDSPRALTMLVDTSASRALGFAGYVADVRGLVEALRAKYGAMLPLRVIAFDQDHEEIFFGPALGYGDAEDRALLARGAAGASNLAQAFDALAVQRRFMDERIVVVTDGVVTAGPDGKALVAAVDRLPTTRLDVVLTGGIRDAQVAASIARAGEHAGDVFDLDRGLDAVVAGLGEQVHTDVPIEVAGAAWVYPRTLPSARAKTTQLVFARMAAPTDSVEVAVGARRTMFELAAATPALVERAVARAKIEELERELLRTEGPAAESLRRQIATRSVAARVISSQTSMLVLETEYDYERYQITRTALADILVVGEHGVEQTKPTWVAAVETGEARESYEVEHRNGAGIDESAGTGTAMALDEGQMGSSRSDRTGGHYKLQRQQEDLQLARQQAIEHARSAGILGTTTLVSGGSFSSLSGTADVPSGFDDIDIYGSLFGADEPNGAFGYGRTGFGPGGWGALGAGRYGRNRTGLVATALLGQPNTQGDLDRTIIRRYLKRNIQRITYCYESELFAKPSLTGTVTTSFLIAKDGTVARATSAGVDPDVANCVAKVIGDIEFPRPRGGGGVDVNAHITFRIDRPVTRPVTNDAWLDRLVSDAAAATGRAARVLEADARSRPVHAPPPHEHTGPAALSGKLDAVMRALRGGNTAVASRIAKDWHAAAPGDVLALIALGETLEAKHDTRRAARIYGSIIDLYPSRADLRRFAGERLGRLGAATQQLVIDTYRRAVGDRPDHLTGHRLLAYALARSGDHAGAFTAILTGLDQQVPTGRFAGADRVLREDAAMLGAVYVANGADRAHVLAELAKRRVYDLATSPSTRFVLYWETDANDVDFHIEDSRGGEASYQNPFLDSGGELYADVRTGYGPECFAIEGKPAAGPYWLSINYFAKGPMGYGMGLLQIQTFDGKALTLEDRPFVIMNDRAFLELGTYR